MSVLQSLVALYTNRLSFSDYRSFSNYLLGRRTRLPTRLVDALTIDHGRIWRRYYRKVRGYEGRHELLLFGATQGPDGQVNGIDGVVLRRTPSSGAEQLDLLYGRHWVIRSTHGINKYRFHQWRKERADRKDARAAGIEGDLDFEDDD